MKKIILLGGGGHCKSVIDTITNLREYKIVGILDIDKKVGDEINNVKIIDNERNIKKYYDRGVKYAFVTVGSTGNIELRKKLSEIAIRSGFLLPTIIDKTAIVSKNARIGKGCFIGKGAIVNSNTYFGENIICNSNSIIEHDCIIGDFVHISPGSTVCGGVKVGENTHVGANSTIIQYLTIGKNTLIGAGSVVTRNIEDNVIGYGNPFKKVRKNE